MTPSASVGDALRAAALRLRASGSRSPRLDAELLLASALDCPRAELLREPGRPLDADEAARFESLVLRREAREPVAYILGRRAFRTIDLEVTRDVLIPRHDTETLVEVALEALAAMPLAGPDPDDEPLALDVGTGSGCVALALAAEDPFVRVVATDVDPAALAVARRNAARLGLARRVEFVLSDLFADVGERPFDLIVSNPPYVPADEYEALEPNVRDYEPRLALYGGEDGLDVYRRLVPGAGAAAASRRHAGARGRRRAGGRRARAHRRGRRLRAAGAARRPRGGRARRASRAAAARRAGADVRAEKARAVVLSSRPLGEADRIVRLFTRELGRVDAVVKGVRKTTSRWGGRLEPFNVCDLVLHPGRSLYTVTQAQLVDVFAHLRADREGLTAAAIVCEAAAGLTPEHEPEERVFALLRNTLRELDAGLAGRAVESPLVLGALRQAAVRGRLPAGARPLRGLRVG